MRKLFSDLEIENRIFTIFQDGNGIQKPHAIIGEGETNANGDLSISLPRDEIFENTNYVVFVQFVGNEEIQTQTLSTVEKVDGSQFVIHCEQNTQRIMWIAIGR